MNKQAPITELTKIRPAYLSDLYYVQSIYKERNHLLNEKNTINQNTKSELTEDFGLPLAIAEYKKTVIGYASVTLNTANQPVIRQFLKGEYQNKETEQQLYKYAERVLFTMYEANTKDYSRLQFYIKRLTDWLNKCH